MVRGSFQRAIYPVRKQAIWHECEQLMKNNVVLLGQANNLSTQKMADLRHRLRGQNLFLRFPKPGILKAYLRETGWDTLEAAVVGPTFCAISRGEPSELRTALETIQAETRIQLLGGKMLDMPFTIEGIKEMVMTVPKLSEMQVQLVGLLQSAGLGLVQGLQQAPQVLAATLETHEKTTFKEQSN